MDQPAGVGADFERSSFTYDGRTRDVYRAGSGPAVVVIHEIPNLHPGVVAFGRRLLDEGYTVFLPSLFGRPGEEPSTGAVDEPGHPTRAALDRVVAFLDERLRPGSV